jgi:CubicO group peptidase (beta-lactamase class C family)
MAILHSIGKPAWLSLALACTVSLSTSLWAADKSEAQPIKGLEQLPERFEQLVKDGVMPGAITMVAQDGQLLHKSVVGYQDIESKTPLTEHSIFRLYSMSKPVTSVAIMMLVEQGKLSLADPVEKFIPEFKNARVYVAGDLEQMETEPLARSITIEDLLAHKSGITYHFTGKTPVHQYYRKHGVKRDTPVGSLPTDGEPAKDLKTLANRLAKAPLLNQPGERFTYSYSTTLLGRIIEIISNEPLDSFLSRTVFVPLKMRHTGFFVTGDALDDFMTNYVMTENGLKVIETSENTDYRDASRLLDGGGALAGTAEDYLRFAMMLANLGELNGERLLTEESVTRLFTPSITIEEFGTDYPIEFGLGFALGDAQTQKHNFMPAGTFGWAGSGNTLFWVDPQRKQAVLFMTQVITPPPFHDKVPFREILIEAVTTGKTQ